MISSVRGGSPRKWLVDAAEELAQIPGPHAPGTSCRVISTGEMWWVDASGAWQPPPSSEGSEGPQGEVGPEGPPGPQGATGAKGDKGDKGDPGADGADGADGAAGATGSTGPQGDTGPAGADGVIPAGVIVMWSGTLASVPSGWALCDGGGGRPDLRDRFIMGWTNAVNPGGTGGSATHTHSDHAALTHSGATVGDHIVTQPANHTTILNHVHAERLQGGTTGTTTGTHLMGSAATGGSIRTAGQSTLDPTSVGTATMSHTATAVDAHTVGQASQHAAQSHASADGQPPYYKLALIIKT